MKAREEDADISASHIVVLAFDELRGLISYETEGGYKRHSWLQEGAYYDSSFWYESIQKTSGVFQRIHSL